MMRLEEQRPVAGISSPGERRNIVSFVVRRVQDGWRCLSAQNSDIVPEMETNVVDEGGRLRPVDYRAEVSAPVIPAKTSSDPVEEAGHESFPASDPPAFTSASATRGTDKPERAMRVRFWGVRGSIPTPGPATVRYGGNTSCVSIEFADGRVLVLDAGTGVRLLGDELARGTAEISMALTHAHWDHIQGFPFFAPLYQPGRTVLFAPHERARSLFDVVLQQMDGTLFPVERERLPCALSFLSESEFEKRTREIAEVTRLSVNHPGGADGIRIRCDGRTVVYIPDNELDPPYEPTARFDEIVAFCRDADVLIHDAQYIDEDMPAKRGWGHSVVGRVCELATEAEVAHLILFHHDPGRTDDQLDAVQDMARARLSDLRAGARCTVAFEGLALEV